MTHAAPLPRPLIEVSHVNAFYGATQALDDVSLSIFEGDFLGIIGPNGGGKTTLLHVMLGLKKQRSGTVSYYNNGTRAREIAIGYLPQENAIDRQFPITVFDVVLSGLSRQKPLLRPFTRAQRQQAMETIGKMGLQGLESRPIGALSGGQLQRAMLARAVVSKPRVLMLDEPNTYIDKRFEAQMYDMLNAINRHCAVVIVSHDIGTVLQNVRNVACVNRTLHYHSGAEITTEDIEHGFGCPVELLGHGDLPHRVLKNHTSNNK